MYPVEEFHPTLEFHLGALFDRVNAVIQEDIEKVNGASLELEIEVATQIHNTIEHLTNRYPECIDKPVQQVMQQLTPATKEVLKKIELLVQRFVESPGKLLSDLQQSAVNYRTELSFTKYQSQLTRVKPQYLVIDKRKPYAFVVFNGHFPCASWADCEPTFSIGGQKCALRCATVQQLVFEVPQKAFQTEINQYQYKIGTLTAPWINIGWDRGWIWNNRPIRSIYRMGLTVLPPLAGSGEVTYESDQKERRENAPQEQRMTLQALPDRKTHNRDVSEKKMRTEKFSLLWNESRWFRPHSGEVIREVTFTNYRGIRETHSGPTLKEFLKIGTVRDSWIVSTEIPKEAKLVRSDLPSTLRVELVTLRRLMPLTPLLDIEE